MSPPGYTMFHEEHSHLIRKKITKRAWWLRNKQPGSNRFFMFKLLLITLIYYGHVGISLVSESSFTVALTAKEPSPEVIVNTLHFIKSYYFMNVPLCGGGQRRSPMAYWKPSGFFMLLLSAFPHEL